MQQAQITGGDEASKSNIRFSGGIVKMEGKRSSGQSIANHEIGSNKNSKGISYQNIYNKRASQLLD